MGISLGFHQASSHSFAAQTFKLHMPLWRALKRLSDIIAVIAGITLFFVPFFVIFFILYRQDGPIFYVQTRIGKNGKAFKCWKFRSMYIDADARLRRYLAENPEARLEWKQTAKLKNDPRVTKIGKFLRRSSLDELPQFYNILIGDMSLVGPRPVKRTEIKNYGMHASKYLSVKPGLTGLWQVSGRNDTSYARRVALDAYYVRHWSLAFDAWVVIKTFFVVFTGRGAY